MRIQRTSAAVGLMVALAACSSNQEANDKLGPPGTSALPTTTGLSVTAVTTSSSGPAVTGRPGPMPDSTPGAGGAPGVGSPTAGPSEPMSPVGSTGSAPVTGSGGSGGDVPFVSAGGAGGADSGGASGSDGSAGGTPPMDLDPSEPLPPVYDDENTGLDCPVATSFPEFSALLSVSEFPDPFLMENGDRISSRADWRCRRAEISAQIQHWELGVKPPPTASEVTASFSGNTLTVDVRVGDKSITLETTINLPSGGTAPYPALIQMDGSGVPANIFTSRGIATMSFRSAALAGQFPTRGQGPFGDLFPDDTAGAYAGWAWGVSRLIDGLELTAEQNQIDTEHLAVTGCSYAGKMALWAGAFDERIALTIPQESGGGGEASWRVMAGQPATENLEEAQGTGWYSERLLQFKNADAPKLPFDQHSLVAMVAPRAILAIQNTAIERLGSEAGGASMKAAAEVYEALGVPDRIGFSQAAASGHCAFPGSQTEDVAAFVERFLLGDESVDTAIMKDTYDTDMARWAPWEIPELR